jgi:hypothetical protein
LLITLTENNMTQKEDIKNKLEKIARTHGMRGISFADSHWDEGKGSQICFKNTATPAIRFSMYPTPLGAPENVRHRGPQIVRKAIAPIQRDLARMGWHCVVGEHTTFNRSHIIKLEIYASLR